MKIIFPASLFFSLLTWNIMAQQAITNPAADAASHAHIFNAELQAEITNAHAVGKIEESRWLSESQFLQAMAEPNVVLLDTQSAMKYQSRHIKGAVNLSLGNLTDTTVAPLVQSKRTRVLIYGNSNFQSGPPNITAFVKIYSYGYTNFFELDPTLDIRTTLLPFAGDDTSK
jgi:hypothetical protein